MKERSKKTQEEKMRSKVRGELYAYNATNHALEDIERTSSACAFYLRCENRELFNQAQSQLLYAVVRLQEYSRRIEWSNKQSKAKD